MKTNSTIEELVPVHHMYAHTTDQENMLPQFLDAMRDNAEGTPADIQEPTDDSAFEKRSRELVTLYRYKDCVVTVAIEFWLQRHSWHFLHDTQIVKHHILMHFHPHTLTPSPLTPSPSLTFYPQGI